jgi:hypothetical protein
MIEFYSASSVDPALKFVSAASVSPSNARRCNGRAALLAFGIAIVLGGCATTPIGPPPAPPAAAPLPRTAEPPPPSVNLSGFPLPYRQGYADGCASIGSVEHKDPVRFKSDGQYRTGWQDGNFLCKKK